MRIARPAALPGTSWAFAAAMLLAGCSFSFHGDLTGGNSAEKAAEAIFAKVPSGGASAAYADVSPAFRRIVGPNAWRAFAVGMGLTHYQGVAWTGQTMMAHGVRVSGLLRSRGAIDTPIDVEMSNGTGAWQMDRIHFHRVDTVTVGEDALEPGMPPGEILLGETALAAACRQLLSHQAVLDQVICMQGTPGVAGAESLCVGITPSRVVGITAHVNSYDRATQDADLSCRITDPDRAPSRSLV